MPFTQLSKVVGIGSVDNTLQDCMICPFARQTRQPFLTSNSHVECPFDLIHIDLWGPYKLQRLMVFDIS